LSVRNECSMYRYPGGMEEKESIERSIDYEIRRDAASDSCRAGRFLLNPSDLIERGDFHEFK
ncbi:hypothetical protein LI169_21500, partial [Desulfovibrio desulfuricans]|nr:hypothetical protein [Desulfovibrio desulfuricans]